MTCQMGDDEQESKDWDKGKESTQDEAEAQGDAARKEAEAKLARGGAEAAEERQRESQ